MRGALLHPTMGTPTKLFLFLLWCCFLSAVNADFNVTLDDSDPLIVYDPPTSWTQSSSNDLDFDGHHMLTDDPSATATLTFTGTAIYYLSPLWPYRLNTLITLDDQPPVLVSLRDHNQPVVENGPETTASQVVWSATGLDNVEHTLVISVGNGEDVAVVDGLLYTIADISTDPTPDPSTTTTGVPTDTSSNPILLPSSSQSSLLPTPTAASASSSSKPAGLSTAIGIVCALFGLLLLGGLFWWWRRRRLQRENEETLRDLPVPPEMEEAASTGRPLWRTRSARYRDIAAHAASLNAVPVAATVPAGRRTRRRPPPPPPHRKSVPVLKKSLTTIPEVSSGLASGTVLTARDVEAGEGGSEENAEAPFAPGHAPAWAEVRLVTPNRNTSGSTADGGSPTTRREDDPWTIRDQ